MTSDKTTRNWNVLG